MSRFWNIRGIRIIRRTEPLAGVAGVIKAALMLERGFVLPNYDFKRPNPKIPWKEWNMKVCFTVVDSFIHHLTMSQVQAMQRPWPKGKRFVSVNNFGFGGTK